MDGKNKAYAIYVVLILIGIVCFTIESKIVTFIALAGLIFIGFIIESIGTKD